MTRSLKNIILNALQAPKESAHQFDTTQRIRAFFRAAAQGDDGHVRKFLQDGVDTTNYENRNFGQHGTKNWLISGIMEAITHGRPTVVPLLAGRLQAQLQDAVKLCTGAAFNTKCEALERTMSSLSDLAANLSMQTEQKLIRDQINSLNIPGLDKAPDLFGWRKNLGNRSPSKIRADFKAVADGMKEFPKKAGLFIEAEAKQRHAAWQARREANKAAAAAAQAELLEARVNATQLKRSLRPLRTIKFKATA